MIHSEMAQIARALSAQAPAGPSPTEASVVENLPEVRMTRHSCDGQCVVCQEGFKSGDEVVGLPCKHRFHRSCLVPWLERHNTCPTCRFQLKPEDSNSNDEAEDSHPSPFMMPFHPFHILDHLAREAMAEVESAAVPEVESAAPVAVERTSTSAALDPQTHASRVERSRSENTPVLANAAESDVSNAETSRRPKRRRVSR